MQDIQRSSLFSGELLDVSYLAARPSSDRCGPIERQSSHVVVLPLAGVFAKHDSSRSHRIATANHAVFVRAETPYRISFPGAIGDKALLLRFGDDVFERLTRPRSPHSATLESIGLLPATAMLQRNLLARELARHAKDPLEAEESSLTLLTSSWHTLQHDRDSTRTTLRNQRLVERVKELISLWPERKWTLTTLGRLAHASPWHLAHVFRNEVGATVYSYVLRARLALALGNVMDGGDITRVAVDCGFSSHSHFTARFRALFGMTPSALRRSTRGAEIKQLRKILTVEPIAAH